MAWRLELRKSAQFRNLRWPAHCRAREEPRGVDREGQSYWIVGRVVEARAAKVGWCLGGA